MKKTIFEGKIQVKVTRKLVFKLICRFKFHFLFCFAIYSRNNFATHSIPQFLYQMVNQNMSRTCEGKFVFFFLKKIFYCLYTCFLRAHLLLGYHCRSTWLPYKDYTVHCIIFVTILYNLSTLYKTVKTGYGLSLKSGNLCFIPNQKPDPTMVLI